MGTTHSDGATAEPHQEVSLVIFSYIQYLLYLVLYCISTHPQCPGGDQPGDAADLPDLDDGSAHHHGPAAAGRGHHGGEDHQGHHHLQELPPDHAGVRLPQGRGHAHHARRYGVRNKCG